MTSFRYEITDDNAGTYRLWSVVENPGFGSVARNFICEGTKAYCERTMQRLEDWQASGKMK